MMGEEEEEEEDVPLGEEEEEDVPLGDLTDTGILEARLPTLTLTLFLPLIYLL